MTTQEEKTAVLAVEQKNMAKEISAIRSDIKSMNEKLDRNFDKFSEWLVANYATKVELDSVSIKVDWLTSLTNRILWGLVTSLLSITIWLIVFIYLNNIK